LAQSRWPFRCSSDAVPSKKPPAHQSAQPPENLHIAAIRRIVGKHRVAARSRDGDYRIGSAGEAVAGTMSDSGRSPESEASSSERRSRRSRRFSSPDWLWIAVIVAVVLMVGVGIVMSLLPLPRPAVPDLKPKPILSTQWVTGGRGLGRSHLNPLQDRR